MKLKSDEPLLLKIYFNNSLLSLSSIPSEALPFLIDFEQSPATNNIVRYLVLFLELRNLL